MAQDTLVLTLDERQRRELESRLDRGDFEARSVAHARWSMRGEGVVATLYESGKLVVQGRQARLFAERYLGVQAEESGASASPRASRGPAARAAPVRVGSDEAGKGDYFGPLVVATVRLLPGEVEPLAKSGVMDSKKLDDSTVLRLEPALRARYAHAVEVLDPPEYNREHARVGNLNELLADMHARAIRSLARAGDDVLIDRFADERLMKERLRDLDIHLRQEPRAERELAVAAASVIARGEFLTRLARLSDDAAVDLHKGAGAPTDKAARRYVTIHGREKLAAVAKVHFKNTAKLG